MFQTQFLHKFEKCRSGFLHIAVPVISEFLFNTCGPKTRTNCRRIEVIHSEFRSGLEYHLFRGQGMNANATENLPALQSPTRPLGRANLLIMFLNHHTYFYFNQSKTLLFYASEPAQKTRSSCGGYGTLVTSFVHLGLANFISPCAVWHTRANIEIIGNTLHQK